MKNLNYKILQVIQIQQKKKEIFLNLKMTSSCNMKNEDG